jgi:anti-sigma B factor antagonist/stage II sporulation protein AA (anti-sigma F factor antagonist)
MSLSQVTRGDDTELFLKGRVDGPAANQLEVEVLAAIKTPVKRLYVNLAEANFLCSAGIRVLLQYHRQMKGQGRQLLVSRTSPEIDQILELTGFRDTLVEKV